MFMMECRLNPQFMYGLDQHTEIMAQGMHREYVSNTA